MESGKSKRLSTKEQAAKLELDRLNRLLQYKFAYYAVVYSIKFN